MCSCTPIQSVENDLFLILSKSDDRPPSPFQLFKKIGRFLAATDCDQTTDTHIKTTKQNKTKSVILLMSLFGLRAFSFRLVCMSKNVRVHRFFLQWVLFFFRSFLFCEMVQFNQCWRFCVCVVFMPISIRKTNEQ